MEKITCAVCNAPEAVEAKVQREAKYKNVPVVLTDVSVYQCAHCGEEFFSPEQLKEFFARLKEASRKKLGLLSPEEIADLRRQLQLRQDDLEELLGAGQKVVTRWERGEVLHTKPVDNLLRLMKDCPDFIIGKLRKFRTRSA